MRILKIPFLFLFFLLLVLLIAGGLVVTAAFLNDPTGAIPQSGVLFQIKKGESSEHVFIRLEQERLIRSSLLMRIISKITDTESLLKTGIYRIRPEQTTLDIHTVLVSGKQEMKKVTIKAGWTLSQIAGALEQGGLISGGAFLQAAASPEIRAK
jgi:cell division protein YceG involved in septum cleavage